MNTITIDMKKISVGISTVLLLFIGLSASAQLSSLDNYVPTYVSSAKGSSKYIPKNSYYNYLYRVAFRFVFDYPDEYMPDNMRAKYLYPGGGKYKLNVAGTEVSTISVGTCNYLGGRYLIKRETGEEFFNQLEGHDPKKTKTLAKLHESYMETYGDFSYIKDYAEQSVKKELGTDYIYASRISKTENEKSFFAIIRQHPVSKDFYFVQIDWQNNYNKSGLFEQIVARLKTSFKPRALEADQIEDASGKIYVTKKYGTQTWMLENLYTEHFQQGRVEIEYGNSDKKPSQLVYENKPSDYETDGRFYNYLAISDSRGICPKGWHVPSKAEYEKLALELQKIGWVNKIEFDKKKDAVTSIYSLGRGYSKNSTGHPFYTGEKSYIWTSTPASAGKIWAVVFRYDSAELNYVEMEKSEQLSCKCVMN